MEDRWVTALASAMDRAIFPSCTGAAENSTSTALMALRMSPPQQEAMYSKAPSSGSAVTAIRCSKKPTARLTAFSAASGVICLNSKMVDRLRMALNT